MLFKVIQGLLTFVLVLWSAGNSLAREEGGTEKGKTFYVRQTVGDDANDGLSPETAWQNIAKLSSAMHAGDIAYVGPGLYRDGVYIQNNGETDERLTFIADTTGQHTGDPPGVVMITGAEPVDEGLFKPFSSPGVYRAKFTAFQVLGVVEMDGEQYRYERVKGEEFMNTLSDLPSSFFYDEESSELYIHTSDGAPPSEHEIELIRRGEGFLMIGKHYITIIGFTFRHVGNAGINFFKGSGDGMAINNTSYGSRQGIRVFNATNIVVAGNTLFRNENSGVYFADGSTNGLAIGNIAYENIKGIRWGSRSFGGIVFGNVIFDNYEAGVAFGESDHLVIRRNTIINNKAQIKVRSSNYNSDENCIENSSPENFTAEFFYGRQYRTLTEYQQSMHQDLQSEGSDCGTTPEKVDVIKLHKDALAYTERAREMLKQRHKEKPD